MNQRPEKSRFADLLLEMRLIEEGELASAMAEKAQTGQRLAKVLSDRRVIDEDRLTKAVAGHLGLETVSVGHLRIHSQVLAKLPAEVARAYGMLPYAVKRTERTEVLFLIMSDPLDQRALGEALRHSGCQIRVVMASATELDHAIHKHYKQSLEEKLPDIPIVNPAIGEPLIPKAADNFDLDQTVPSFNPMLPPFDRIKSETKKAPSTLQNFDRGPDELENTLASPPLPRLSRSRTASLALEVPVVVEDDRNHPFQPFGFDMRVGLEETGIIPEVNVGRDSFEPPPPELFPSDPNERRSLQASDIPTSPAEVEARWNPSLDDDEDELLEFLQVDMVEESSLQIEEHEVQSVLLTSSVSHAPEIDDLVGDEEEQSWDEPTTSVFSLDGHLPPPLPDESRDNAERLVASLEDGASLNATERVRLVLAIGRLLLKAGIIDRNDLLDELEER